MAREKGETALDGGAANIHKLTRRQAGELAMAVGFRS